MSAAAVKIENNHDTTNFVAEMAAWRYRVWRQYVEGFKTTIGARPVLEHLPEEVWAQRFAANDDAFSAVVEELERIE